ncbi:hypothetical protein ACFU8R_24015 [Pseudonocardia alni]|uniref:hypothetical protein n=1 Tax=Pseudonocardia alni TaxID=33907 RepID=UPI0036B7D999
MMTPIWQSQVPPIQVTIPPTPVPWQTTVAAVGTIITVTVALYVAMRESRGAKKARADAATERSNREREDRRRGARLVAGWVEEEYFPSSDGSAYIRKAVAHISNEGDQPVFQVAAAVHVGSGRSIGPLAIPQIIPVVPPRRDLRWDITIPLLAHDDTESPHLEVRFSDPNGNRWTRSPNGDLVETTGEEARLFGTDLSEADIAGQVGRPDSLNPWMVAHAFVTLLQEGYDLDNDVFKDILDPVVGQWRESPRETATAIRDDLQNRGFTGFARYPAPHVARIILPIQEQGNSQVVVGDVVALDASVIQLTYLRHQGWRVFSYHFSGAGVFPPDRIPFAPGSLHEDDRIPPYLPNVTQP